MAAPRYDRAAQKASVAVPTIPLYQQRTSSLARFDLAPISPAVAGAPAAAMGELAGAVQGTALKIDQTLLADAAVKGADVLSQLRLDTEAMLTQEQESPDGIDGFTPRVTSAFDRRATELLGEGSSKLSRGYLQRALKPHIAALREDVASKAMSWEAGQRAQVRIDTAQSAAQKAATAVSMDPDTWASAAAEQKLWIDGAGFAPATRSELHRRMIASITSAAAEGYAKRDPAGTLTRLNDRTDKLFMALTPEARDQVQRTATAQLVEQKVAGIVAVYQHQGSDAGTDALGELEASNLTPAMQDEVRKDVSGRLSQFRDQRRQENVATIATIERSIANDTAGSSTTRQVEDLYRIGALTPAEYGNYLGQVEASTVRRFKDGAAARELAAALNAGLPLDPNNADHRKALKSAFVSDTREMPIGSAPWQATAAAYAAKARMLPEPALGWIRQTIRSPDPQIAAAGAQFFGAIGAASPDATGEVDTDTKAFAGVVNSMIEAGTQPARAVETARTNVFELKPGIAEQRKQQYTQGSSAHARSSDAALDALIDRDFDTVLSRQPAASAALKADFGAQAERYFMKTGDIGLARDLAWTDLRRVYGPSSVNGSPMVMAFPPERFGVTPDDVRRDVGNFLKGNPQSDGSGAADVFVVPDAITLRQVNNSLDGRSVQPSFKLVTKTGDLVLDRHGVPQRWTLPTGEELTKRFKDAEAVAASDAQKLVEQARADREVRRVRAEQLRRGELR